ncbi:MAG: methyl-accepting chemotaxis protein [Planctomycetota bacterium]
MLVPVCGVVAVMYRTTAHGADQISQTAEEELRAHSFDYLMTLRDFTKRQFEQYVEELVHDIEAMAKNPFLRDAYLELDAAAAAARSRNLEGLDILKDEQYKDLYDKYVGPLQKYLEHYGYDDLLFLDAEDGHISFSLLRASDFGQRAIENIANSPLADAWQRAAKKGTTAISDFNAYDACDGLPCQFLATPILADGATIGILAYRLSPTHLNTHLGLNTGMGQTGEVYFVGPDKLMRSDSLRDPENHSVVASFNNPSAGAVDTEAVDGALRGEMGTKVIADYRGRRVLSAYAPADVLGLRWALMAELDYDEALAAVHQVQQLHDSTTKSLVMWAAGLSGLCLLAVLLVGLGVHRGVSRPIRRMAETAARVALGDLTAEVPAEGKSETGALARAMNQMTANLARIVSQITTASVKMEAASKEQTVGANNQSTATAEMSTTAGELLATAQQVARSGTSVAEQASTAANECASGTKSVQDAVQGITGIRDRVERVAEHMVDLGGKSQQISGVLDIINELAEQTNLLSLNASIEAAGAGEAGKRFAVVAGEIRKLAERAGESTIEIRGLIDSVQQTINGTIMATEEGTKAVQEGVRLTAEAEGSFERIASQVASTRESAKAIEMASGQQATALEQMDGAVRNIDTTAQQADATSRQVQTEAQALAEAAGRFWVGREGTQTR